MKTTFVIASSIVFLALFLSTSVAYAQEGIRDYNFRGDFNMNNMEGTGGGACCNVPFFGQVHPLIAVLYWVVVVAIALALLSAIFGGGRDRYTTPIARAGERSDMQILRDRYARGEITREEFEEAKRSLM